MVMGVARSATENNRYPPTLPSTSSPSISSKLAHIADLPTFPNIRWNNRSSSTLKKPHNLIQREWNHQCNQLDYKTCTSPTQAYTVWHSLAHPKGTLCETFWAPIEIKEIL